jgi:hypothetical protein
MPDDAPQDPATLPLRQPESECAPESEPAPEPAPGGEPGSASEPTAGGSREPELLPATTPVGPRPRAAVAVRGRGAGSLVRDTVARLARNPVAVTTALVGAGLAVRLAPAVLGREVLRAAPAVLPAALPAVRAATDPEVVRHVVHHHVVHHHVVRQVVQVVVHVRPSPPPGVL